MNKKLIWIICFTLFFLHFFELKVEASSADDYKIVSESKQQFLNQFDDKIENASDIYDKLDSFYDNWKKTNLKSKYDPTNDLLKEYFINKEEFQEYFVNKANEFPEKIEKYEIRNIEQKENEYFIKVYVKNDSGYEFYHYIYLLKDNDNYKLSFTQFYEKIYPHQDVFKAEHAYFELFYLAKSLQWSKINTILSIYDEDKVNKIKENLYTDEEIQELFKTESGQKRLLKDTYYSELTNIATSDFIQEIKLIELYTNGTLESLLKNDLINNQDTFIEYMATSRQLVFKNFYPEDEFFFVSTISEKGKSLELFNTDIDEESYETYDTTYVMGIALVLIVVSLIVLGIVGAVINENRQDELRRNNTTSRDRTTTVQEENRTIVPIKNVSENIINIQTAGQNRTNQTTDTTNTQRPIQPKPIENVKPIESNNKRTIQVEKNRFGHKNDEPKEKETLVETKRKVYFDD